MPITDSRIYAGDIIWSPYCKNLFYIVTHEVPHSSEIGVVIYDETMREGEFGDFDYFQEKISDWHKSFEVVGNCTDLFESIQGNWSSVIDDLYRRVREREEL